MSRLAFATVLLMSLAWLSPAVAAGEGSFGSLSTESGEQVGQGFVVSTGGLVIGHVRGGHLSVRLATGGHRLLLRRIEVDGSTGVSLWKPEPADQALEGIRAFEVSKQSYLRTGMAARALTGNLPSGVTGRIDRVLQAGTATERWLVRDMPVGEVKPGSPLLNGCGQLEGIVYSNEPRAMPSSVPNTQRDRYVLVVPLPKLAQPLITSASDSKQAALPCDIDRRDAQVLQAQEGKNLAERRADEERASRELAEREARAAAEAASQSRRREDEHRLRLAKAEEAAREQKLEEERAAAELRTMAESRTRLLWIVAAVALAAITLAASVVVRRQRQRRFAEQQQAVAEQRAQLAQDELQRRTVQDSQLREVPDVLLSGAFPDGWKLALTVPGSALLADGGVLVGRNPPPPGLVINHEEVSRRHLRLRWARDHVEIEDVGSMNGTSVDGKELKAGDMAVLRDGSTLRLGELKLSVGLIHQAT